MRTDEAEARTLLVVEDDEILRGRLCRAFEERGFAVRPAADVPTAERLAREDPPELALVDLRIGDSATSGLAVVGLLRELDPATTVVVLTGYGSIATALEAVRLGAAHYLTKPADIDEILAAFARGGGHGTAAPDATPSTPSLARVEWEHINRVLVDCGGNVSQAARALGIHRRSLQRKLSRFPAPR